MFELGEIELKRMDYYNMYNQIKAKLDLAQVSVAFNLTEFDLVAFYCKYYYKAGLSGRNASSMKEQKFSGKLFF